MRRLGLGVLALTAVAIAAPPASAQSYRIVEDDDTVYVSNPPTTATPPRLAAAPVPAMPGGPIGVTPAVLTARTTVAGSSFLPHIRDAAARYGVPEELVTAVIRVESAFNPRAVSRKGARGLMQLMPGTASLLGVRDSFDPVENIDGGVRHLRGLIDRFGNNVALALAAYNAGEKAVTQYGGIPPYPETQDYVARILRFVGVDAGATAEVAETPVAPSAPTPTPTYRFVEDDGTTVYTNIPRARR